MDIFRYLDKCDSLWLVSDDRTMYVKWAGDEKTKNIDAKTIFVNSHYVHHLP